MKEQFVPYRLAVKMKELGFDEECLGSYMGYNTKDPNLVIRGVMVGQSWDVICTAPLWQQAFDWFREYHFRHAFISKLPYGYSCGVDSEDGNQIKWDRVDYYIEAKIKCLEMLIESVV